MMLIGDIWLEHDVDDGRISAAVAAAFGVGQVSVWPQNAVASLGADVIVQREREQGDFPCHLALTATATSDIETMPDDRFRTAIETMARLLGQSVFTQLGEQYPGDFFLVVPSGESMVVGLDEDAGDEGRIELTPESRRRWEALAAVTAAD